MMKEIKNKYDFVALVEVKMSNLNGDPDNANYPRTTADGRAIVTDVCIKHKIREYVKLAAEGKAGYEMYVESGKALQKKQRTAYGMLGIEDTKEAIKQASKDDPDLENKLKECLCKEFYDIRSFGAALTGFKADGIGGDGITGPVQIAISTSVDPVEICTMTLTRCAPEKEDNGSDVGIKGQKSAIAYALFRIEGHISAPLAEKTGFTTDDMELLWEALLNMFDNDHAAARGNISTRALYIFKHDNRLGNARWANLADKLHIKKAEGCEYPEKYEDYTITVDKMPEGVELTVRE